jgi:hypothetical protein
MSCRISLLPRERDVEQRYGRIATDATLEHLSGSMTDSLLPIAVLPRLMAIEGAPGQVAPNDDPWYAMERW